MGLTRRKCLRLAALGATATALAGCQGDDGASDGGTAGADGDSDGGDAPTETVDMVGSQFDPRNLTVATGTTVEWVNEDSAAHTVTAASDNWSFDQEAAGGDAVTHTFQESGLYEVYCRFHGDADLGGMSMKIAVGDAVIQDPLGAEGGGGGY